LRPSILKHVNYTKLQNVAGTPAISLPLFAAADTMPIGSMFAAAHGNDDLLLALAFQLEREQPWASRWPACFLEAAR
jgi:amidase